MRRSARPATGRDVDAEEPIEDEPSDEHPPEDVPAERASGEGADAEQPEVDDSADESGDIGPVDQLGIPMSRKPTIDDVRGDSESHRRLALGCSVAVALALVAFWLVRAVLLG